MLKLFKRFKEFLNRLFCTVGSVDYMVALPSPLSADDEQKYLRLNAEGDKDAFNTLIEHNLRLVVYIAKRFDNTGVDQEELISVGTMGLIKAVRSYNGDKKIKLATYASRCIENEILMYLRKMLKTRNELSLDEPLNVDWEGNKLLLSDVLGTDGGEVYKEMESEVELQLVRELYSGLNERDREIVKMRYGLFGETERTQKEIADMMSISQSYISRLEKRIIAKLKQEYKKKEEKWNN